MAIQSDEVRLRELHSKSGVECPFPDLNELFDIPVVVNDRDEVVMAVGSMPAVEIYLFIDKSWETPGMRMEAFKILHELVRKDLLSKGIIEAHAFVPPEIAKFFSRRLAKLGWNLSHWLCFSRRTDHG